MSDQSFTKLFSSIIHSTIWREPDHVRVVWITMLALADSDGYVGASIPGLADIARVSRDECQTALDLFHAPDTDSRSQQHEGRRIMTVDRGWLILNYTNFRKKMSAEEIKERKRLWWKENRGKDARKKLDETRPTRHKQKQSTEAEILNTDSKESVGGRMPDELDTPRFSNAWEAWRADRRERKKPLTPRAEAMQLKNLSKMGESRAVAALEHSIANGYQGIYEPKNDNHQSSTPQRKQEPSW